MIDDDPFDKQSIDDTNKLNNWMFMPLEPSIFFHTFDPSRWMFLWDEHNIADIRSWSVFCCRDAKMLHDTIYEEKKINNSRPWSICVEWKQREQILQISLWAQHQPTILLFKVSCRTKIRIIISNSNKYPKISWIHDPMEKKRTWSLRIIPNLHLRITWNSNFRCLAAIPKQNIEFYSQPKWAQ